MKKHQALFTEFRRLRLVTPSHVQLFIDALPYNSSTECNSPKIILEKKKAHCAEGAYFAASALNNLGYPPLVVDLAAENDDDHLIAVYRIDGLWGAIAKSNTTLLRGRQPVYQSLRELVMSYFDFYFNPEGYFSLRGYTRPINLNRFGLQEWMETSKDLNEIGERTATAHHYPCVVRKVKLLYASTDIIKACFMKSDPKGLYKPHM